MDSCLYIRIFLLYLYVNIFYFLCAICTGIKAEQAANVVSDIQHILITRICRFAPPKFASIVFKGNTADLSGGKTSQ